MKDWWAKRKAKKAAKKQAKADAKATAAANQELATTGVQPESMLAGPAQSLGSDSANRVYKTDNKPQHAFASGETAGYFKPNQDMAPAKNAVAASRLAEGSGFGDLIPETRFANLDTGNGMELGALSAAAQGDALLANIFDTDITHKYKGQNLDETEFGDTRKRKGDKVMAHTGAEINDIDLSRPETQSGLNRLQWFDALIGNMDRHGANILVDPTTGKVSGIDNDLSFSRGVQAKWGTGFTGGAGHFLGLPDMIDEATADALLALDDAKITQLLQTDNKAAGEGKVAQMPDKAVQETLDRLKIIQAKVKALKADTTGTNLVRAWDQSTYDRQLNMAKHQDGKNVIEPNYIARHAGLVAGAKDTSVGGLWRKGYRTPDTTAPPPVPAPVASASPVPAPPIPAPTGADGGGGSDTEQKQVAQLVGAPMPADQADQHVAGLIAQLEDAKDGGSGPNTLPSRPAPPSGPSPRAQGPASGGGPRTLANRPAPPPGPSPRAGRPPGPTRPARPPAPNVAGPAEEKDDEAERKARFLAARAKFH